MSTAATAKPQEPGKRTSKEISLWAQGLRSGDRRCLARALTIVDNNLPQLPILLQAIFPLTGNALVIGFTGSPGVGKSTLLSALIGSFRARGLKVGVVAVDPSSVHTGGAILGDRIRMQKHAQDNGVFIRSLASRGQLGGLSRSAARVIDVLDAAGMNIILIETVGTGQSEIEVAEIAAVRVVIVQPGAGDSIQALKAGILEIADLIVINKADLPGAGTCENELRHATRLRGEAGINVILMRTIATRGEGVNELAQELIARSKPRRDVHNGLARMRRLLVNEICSQLSANLLAAPQTSIDAITARVMRAEITLEQAASEILDNGVFPTA